jgi:serine/threonine protein kinase/WD40 repeat protein
MNDASGDGREPVEVLAEEFVERRRRGETPSLAEYIARYPHLAADIRDLFPALVLMDDIDPRSDDLGRAEAEDHAEPLGQVGDYRILRRIGAGGMGVVYEAEQVSLGRRVALKVLSPQALGDAKARERFRREARSAARLHHTNIVPVFEVGQEGEVCYYAMQLISGQSLDQVIRELRRLRAQPQRKPEQRPSVAATAFYPAAGPSPATAVSQAAFSLLTGVFEPPAGSTVEASRSAVGSTALSHATSALSATAAGHRPYYRSVARIGQQAALALAHAHARGIVHRDVKPSNLLLDEAGVVWVTDFGLAKTEDDNLTRTGELPGTLRYMAPERFGGQCDARADIYALGLTLYELLLLEPAFPASDRLHLLEHIRNHEPARPRAVDGRVPRDLETVVLKAIDKDPQRRYHSADALAEDLRRFLADEPIQARRTRWHERARRWCRRNPGWAAMLVVSLALLAVIFIGGAYQYVQLRAALTQSQQAERERKRQLFESLLSDAKARRFSGRAGQRFGTLEAVQKAAALATELQMPRETSDELRNLAIAALALPDLHVLNEVPNGWPDGSRGLSIDDTLQHYARGDNLGNITVRRLSDDVEIARLTGLGPAVTVAGFADDGALLLLDATDKSLKRWRFADAETVTLGRLPSYFAKDVSNIGTADGKLVATLHRKTGTLAVHDMAGRHLRDIPLGGWATSKEPIPDFMWDMHPWQHELAITLGGWDDPERSVVLVLDLDRGTVTRELPADAPADRVHGISWHPDGRTLAVGYTYVVILWDIVSGKATGRIKDHKGGALGVSISSSGQLMSTQASWTGGVKFWHPYTRKPLLSLPGMTFQPSRRAPDGRMSTYRIEGTRLEVWVTEPSPILRVLVRGPALGEVREYRRSSVHRDGRLVAAGSSQGVSLFDLASGLDVGHLDLGHNLTAQFDPASGDLLTSGLLGLFRWPVRADPDKPDHVRVGPPQRLLAQPAADNEFRVSADGKTIAAAQYSRVLVLHADQPGRPVILEPTVNVRQQLSISPDGRWVATGSHGGGDVHVWDSRTGQLVKTQRLVDAGCHVLFTPDGERLLVSNGGPLQSWRVGDWEEGLKRIERAGIGSLSPDGRFLACESGEGALRLVSTATGREVARLESPEQGRCDYTTFSPDGRLLITANVDYAAIHVWDLHAIRRHLRDMHLDWDGEPFPGGPDGPRLLPPPLHVEIDLGDLAGLAQKRRQAIDKNDAAWHLVTGDPSKRDPVRALLLIEQAVRDDPDNPALLNTLGVVQYRNGLYREAATTLERSLVAGYGSLAAFDLFFLAMAYERLGNSPRARDRFDRAVKWWKAQKELHVRHAAELKEIRAEAEEVLKIAASRE